jgi:hypothetical protein
MTREQSADERITENMLSRMGDIERYFSIDDDDERDHFQENELDPLAIDREILIHIQLSTGGPGDGFKLRYSTDGDLLGGVYYFADWYDYAERPLSTEEADQVAEAYGIYVEPEA